MTKAGFTQRQKEYANTQSPLRVNVSFSSWSEIFKAPTLWNIVFMMTMLVYAAGLFITIMEPDAAVYAEVSMEMHDSGNFLSIMHKAMDWLDKPPFPFWMSAISYSIFGVSAFAYKLPAVAFVLLAAVYTFLFARRFYSPLHGWIAVIILITAQHIIISNQDVRAEPFMTGLVIMALYHLAIFTEGRRGSYKWIHALAGSLALACLMMTKGLFTIIPVAAGLGLSLLYQKKWKQTFHWQWLMIIVFTGIFLFPTLYGYYQQFDLHPEKEVFGEKNVSGVKFFLWTSQWGRFTNTGPIKGKGDLFYFVHTMLWAFLPWAFAAFFALFKKTKQLIKGLAGRETYTYFGFITLFLIFSFSRFQLSFYLNPLFPLLAIITTDALLSGVIKTLKTFSIIHVILCFLLLVALFVLNYFFVGTMPHADTLLILFISIALATYLFIRNAQYIKKIIFATALVCLSVNYYLNRDFYPALMHYQAESEAGYYIKEKGIPPDKVVFVGPVQSVADIILHHVTKVVDYDTLEVADVSDKIVFTSQQGRQKLDSLAVHYRMVAEFPDFPVTRLTGKFINRKTRSSELEQKFLLKTDRADFMRPVLDVTIR